MYIYIYIFINSILGYGEIVPLGNNEIMLSIFVMLIGAFVFAYIGILSLGCSVISVAFYYLCRYFPLLIPNWLVYVLHVDDRFFNTLRL
jgi:hypothetical protein